MNLLMLSLLFVFFINAAYGVIFGCILDVPSIGRRTLETEVRTLVSVSVTVVAVYGRKDRKSVHIP